jgi:hypothetical protein
MEGCHELPAQNSNFLCMDCPLKKLHSPTSVTYIEAQRPSGTELAFRGQRTMAQGLIHACRRHRRLCAVISDRILETILFQILGFLKVLSVASPIAPISSGESFQL